MVPSDVLGVGVRDADELRLNDSGDVLDRVLGPDAHEVDRDLDDAPEEEDAETGVRRDFDSPVEVLAHDGAEVLPVGVVKIPAARAPLHNQNPSPAPPATPPAPRWPP